MSDALRKWLPLDIAEFDDLNEESSDRVLASYMRLFVKAWKSGGVLNGDAQWITRIAKNPEPIWRVALTPFELVPGVGWVHHGMRSESARTTEISDKRRDAAKARWDAQRAAKRPPNVIPIADPKASK